MQQQQQQELQQQRGRHRVCVVTGGSQGIGAAIVQAFLNTSQQQQQTSETKTNDRWIVYNLDVQEPQQQQQQQEEATERALPPSFDNSNKDQLCFYYFKKVNVADVNAFTTALHEVFREQEDQLDVLVNNAGVFETTENHNVLWDKETSTPAIQDVVMTNLLAVIQGTRTATQLFQKQQQKQQEEEEHEKSFHIVNIASTAALGPFPNHPVYAATKAAVWNFSHTAAIDLRNLNKNNNNSNTHPIHVHCICPGIIDTPMGRLGGPANAAAVAALKGGKRTSPTLVAQAVLDCIYQAPPALSNSRLEYTIVENHEIYKVPYDS